MSFYIEKIIVTGPGKSNSIIELSKGVNIIYGPSNTGKSCIVRCIDYIFGSDREPFDTSNGYQYVKILVKTQYGDLTMSRKIGENYIDVSSEDDRIMSGKYKSKASRNDYQRTINYVWLLLMGIDDLHLVIKNENYEKQILSWRTFCHMFMLTETKIISEVSAILPERNNLNTAVISSLIFLLTGQDFAETESKDKKEIKDAKREAVKAYINKELFRLSERNQELVATLKEKPNIDINREIEKILSKISEYDQQLQLAMKENQSLLSQLHEKNETLSECNVLLNRYDDLNSQYKSDLKRLSFIIDGQTNMSSSFSSHCPFCDGKIETHNEHNYIEAAKADYKKIKLQSTDLEKALGELIAEKLEIEQEIQALISKRESTEALIEHEIKPQMSVLKEKLASYRSVIECQNEIAILKRISQQKTIDIIENEADEDNNVKFKVKEHLDYSFIESLSNNIKVFLEECKYDNLFSLTFDKSTMDIIVNGNRKSTNGKGYNAYFNSAVAIVLGRYMHNQALYSPNILILDSPILSLKDKETKKPSETMGNALFENIIKNQDGIQTIIVENEIPEINYADTRLIHFTKDKNNGRYGFLLEVQD